MDEKKVAASKKVSVVEEVEGHLEKLMSMKREEIEKDLHAKIRQEQEDAERRINRITNEFNKGREMLVEYKTVLTEFEGERGQLETEIRSHFNKAVDFQTEIERMAGLTLEQLRKVHELNQKLESLNLAADEKTAGMRKDLEEKFGIVTEAAGSRPHEDLKFDLNQELQKLKKIKDLLAAEGMTIREPEEVQPVEARPFETTPEDTIRVETPQSEPTPEETIQVETVQVQNQPEDIPATAPQEPAPPSVQETNETSETVQAAEDASPRSGKNSFKVLFEKLGPFRQTNNEDGNGGITYFQNDRTSVLDGERLLRYMTDNLDEIRKLFQKLPLADTPKGLFFIKQDIINHQESLRKYIGHVVRLCDKKGWGLPRFTADVLNIQVLKEFLERLTTENWSQEGDFSSFAAFVENIRNAYDERITPPAVYLRSVIDELGIN